MSLGIFHQKLACVWVKPSQGHHFRQKVACRCHLRFWKSDSAEHLAMMRGKTKKKLKGAFLANKIHTFPFLLSKNLFLFSMPTLVATTLHHWALPVLPTLTTSMQLPRAIIPQILSKCPRSISLLVPQLDRKLLEVIRPHRLH